MKEEKYLDDLKEIKDIMNRSSRFISLSGLSGVGAGVVALLGVYAAYQTVYARQDYFHMRYTIISTQKILSLLTIAGLTLLGSLFAGVFFTWRKARKNNQGIWDIQAQRLVVNLLIPLVVGGLVCLILLINGFVGLVAPLTLVFYGMGLLHASKYTLTDIRNLGIAEMILGILALQFIGYGLVFWAIGFGVLHIIYGIVMHFKYDR